MWQQSLKFYLETDFIPGVDRVGWIIPHAPMLMFLPRRTISHWNQDTLIGDKGIFIC